MIADECKKIKNNFIDEIKNCSEAKCLSDIKIRYLGRKGIVSSLFKSISSLTQEERKTGGRELNLLKEHIEKTVREKESELRQKVSPASFFDPTLTGEKTDIPGNHPLKAVMNSIIYIFTAMGFGIAYGPEIEENYYNFTALNFPENHPARDMHDTLYLKEKDTLLRTHTSPVQIRTMEKHAPPYKFIAPGKCYRRDTIDASHSPVFHQVEGFMVDRDISFADLKGVLDEFARRIFEGSQDIKTRFRPSFFPFTEPSAEMDIMCSICRGKGCSSCSGKGWLEILGAGMVDPEVFRYCKVDPDKWQGFAFGMGVERIAMLKYGISDMRLFFQNDLRFLRQF
ncbi:MAG: phenylalanine--tRNA ligase subunit alpha [Elusimicrobia bacterium]|nr:phenylalanine--tRNA ligase subunit alpha [Elusimicrobiota bacterium]